MATARFTAPGEVHHVISRFVEERFFINTDDERAYYLHLLGKAMGQTDWLLLAYAVMSNHIHLAFIGGARPSESWSRRVNSPFANWYNELHERIGPVFAARAKMWVTRTEHVGSLIAYIHNNPVRAGVVRRAARSTWTSHRAYLGLNVAPPWLQCERGLELTGIARDEFDDWVHERRKTKRDDPSLREIDRETRRLGAIVLGTPKISPLDVPLLARRTAHLRPTPGRLVEIVSDVLGLERGEIFDASRHGVATAARAIAIQVGVRFGVPRAATGDAIGIRKSAASRLAARRLDESHRQVLELVHTRLLGEMRSRA